MSYRLVLADVCKDCLANHIIYHQTKMRVDNANGKEVKRLLQYLMSVYGHMDLIQKATVQVCCI